MVGALQICVPLGKTFVLPRAQYSYGEAESLYERSLKIKEKALGPDHFDVADSLNNLAVLYVRMGEYGEAESHYERALRIWEKAMGPNHPYFARSLNSLALLYDNQGKYTEAEPLYKRALQIWEKVRGSNHPDVAQSLNNLAALYYRQGRYTEAEPLYKRALKIGEKALEPDHPGVALSLNNLAELYSARHGLKLFIKLTAKRFYLECGGPDKKEIFSRFPLVKTRCRSQSAAIKISFFLRRTPNMFCTCGKTFILPRAQYTPHPGQIR